MKQILELVRGAVSDKDLLPVLTHFHIYDGRVQGGNGFLAIDAPCPELSGFDCTVPAERFLKAVDACDGEPKLKLTEPGKLVVSKGKFRATLPLANHAAFPKISRGPSSEKFTLTAPLLPALRKLYPFISTDRSRPWICGVLFRGGFAWATNAICLARVPYALPEIVFPLSAIDELLRIGEEPEFIEWNANWALFHFTSGWWLRAALLDGEWPAVARLMPEAAPEMAWPAKLLAEAVRKVLPFCPDPKYPVIRTGPDGVSTLEGEMSAIVGHEGLPEGRFRTEPLLAALDTATNIDLGAYPGACYWHGDGIDGVVVGMRI
jgi:DNA polymerase III sliding clamp (beta) subunit (PCNA family)